MTYPSGALFPSSTLFPSADLPDPGSGVLSTRRATLGTLEFNVFDGAGVWWMATLDGWAGSPASTLPLQQKSRAHGAWRGKAFLTAKTLVLSGAVEAPSADQALAAADRLNAAASLDDTILTVTEGSLTRSCICTRQGEVLVTWVNDTAFIYSVQLLADDPRKFATALTGTAFLPATSGGLTVPLDVPVVIAETVISGSVGLTNPGNTNGPVVLRIDGPVSGPVITHVGSGTQLVFSTSLVLGAGEWLDVDMEAQTALANGTASRNGYIQSRGFSQFEPGPNSWFLTAVTYNAGTQLRVTATPAWL